MVSFRAKPNNNEQVIAFYLFCGNFPTNYNVRWLHDEENYLECFIRLDNKTDNLSTDNMKYMHIRNSLVLVVPVLDVGYWGHSGNMSCKHRFSNSILQTFDLDPKNGVQTTIKSSYFVKFICLFCV